MQSPLGNSSAVSTVSNLGLRLPQPRILERTLWLVAALSFVSLAVIAASAAYARWESQAMAATSTSTQTHLSTTASLLKTASLGTAPESGRVIGRMEIPDLNLSVPITTGVETLSLLRGVGHVEGSAMPGGLGTIVLAGHRDTYLRPLEKVAKGMTILVADKTGFYRYSVDRWEIVSPEEVEAVAIRSRPELALVTCYPFHFIGPAPKRFIVHAHLVSLEPVQTLE
jgi:sortase A